MRYLIIPIIILLTSCSRYEPQNAEFVDALPQIYPDYTFVTVPANIAPLNFQSCDTAVQALRVTFKGKNSELTCSAQQCIDINIGKWHKLLDSNIGDSLTVSVSLLINDKWLTFKSFPIYISPDSIDYGVHYRLIAPGYGFFSDMGLYERNLSNFEESALLENTLVPNQCINCHTANRTNPEQYAFHVRGQHGATVVHRNGEYEFLTAMNDSLGGNMVYPYWHPGGRYCAFSTNKTSQMFHTANVKRIEVYDNESDVFVYDAQTHTILKDTLTMKLMWAENTPVFSPDGQWLYYTTALRQFYPPDYDKELYSLCRVSFDEKTGRLGTQVDTLINTAITGKSVTWPRPSYDGRYLMYTQVDYGYFSIWHPEADLWMLDLQTMQTRPIAEANSKRCESFHNWSTNSRWFLFTSRRDDGLYTKLYCSHIDAQGKVSKPFLLPQRNPREYYRMLMYSYNTPDFVAEPIKANPRELGQAIEGDKRTSTKVIMN